MLTTTECPFHFGLAWSYNNCYFCSLGNKKRKKESLKAGEIVDKVSTFTFSCLSLIQFYRIICIISQWSHHYTVPVRSSHVLLQKTYSCKSLLSFPRWRWGKNCILHFLGCLKHCVFAYIENVQTKVFTM